RCPAQQHVEGLRIIDDHCCGSFHHRTGRPLRPLLVKRLDDIAEAPQMVKLLDDDDLSSIDHIGIALWRAALAWRTEMRSELAARGFVWHLHAGGEVLAHLGPSGISQQLLTERMGLSKQAVQQLVDRLEADGVVRREPDATDRRAKRITLT